MVKNKANMRKRSRTFLMLYYWAKLLGLNPLTLKTNNELAFSCLGLFYGCFLSVISLCTIYFASVGRLRMYLPGDSPIGRIAYFVGVISEISEKTLTWLSFGFCQKRMIFIIESFAKAQMISLKIGIFTDNEKYFRHSGFHLIIINALYITWATFNISTSVNYYINHIHGIVFSSMLRMASFNMLTIFVWSFKIVKENFHQLNDKVRFLMRNQLDNGEQPRSIRNFRNFILLSDKIESIFELHRQLRDVIYCIQEYFGLVVLLNIMFQLSSLAVHIYFVYRFLKERSGSFTAFHVVYMCHIFMRVITPLLVLTIISNVCGSTSDEANETGNILHAMLNECDDLNNTQTARQLTLLSLNLLQNQIKISLLGFLDLNHFFVYKAVATAAAFFTIMLQFYN